MKKGLYPQRSRRCSCGCDDTELQIHPVSSDMSPEIIKPAKSDESEKEVLTLENEMWERFYGTGFWRSISQRESHNGK